MEYPKIPANENVRLAKLASYKILDTVSEQEFDDITEIASQICGTPIALISLVDKDRQWFKSRHGLEATETPRDISFCGHAINGSDMFEVENAIYDQRFKDNPLVQEGLGIRFYAGMPLVTSTGEALGTLCVIDKKPKALTGKQKKAMKILARQVMSQLELRRKNFILSKLLKETERLKRENKNKALVAAKTHSAVLITNAAGEIEYTNPAFTQMTGYTLEEVIGKKPGSVLQGEGTDPEHIKRMRDGIQSLRPFNQEILNYSKDGKPYWLSIAISPVFDAQGNHIKFIAVEHDVSDQKLIEQELIDAKEKAITNERVKDQFLSNMSHEIRTPMNAIIGISNILLEEQDLGSKHREMIQHVNGAAKHLLRIINDILDLSKINSEELTFEQINFDFPDIFKKIEYALGLKAEEQGIDLSINLDPSIPSLMAGDPTRLNQILLNLLSNAIKFTERGSVSVTARLSTTNDVGPRVYFEIKDTGIGMTEEELGKIFNKFTQSNKTVSRLYGGTGLGLSIAKQLVEKYDGSIAVSSEVGKGSTFIFDLQFAHPLEQHEAMVIDTDFVDLTSQEKAEVKILLAEDNKLNQLVAKKQLKAYGFNVDIANNGEEAIIKLKEQDYDLILMDVNMPVMNGLDATKYIRQHLGAKANIKIAAMTASVLPKDIQICFASGMDDFISKPFEPKSMYHKVVSLVRNKKVTQVA